MPLKMRGKILPKPKETPPEVPSNETNSQLEPLETAIDKQIGDLVPQKTRREVISRISTKLYAEYFSGPIAHPRHLREYNDISPGAADRIITMAEKNADHRRAMAEKNADHRRTMASEKSRADISDRKLGMLLGMCVLILWLLAAFFSAILLDNELVAGLFLGSAVLGAGLFVKGRNK